MNKNKKVLISTFRYFNVFFVLLILLFLMIITIVSIFVTYDSNNSSDLYKITNLEEPLKYPSRKNTCTFTISAEDILTTLTKIELVDRHCDCYFDTKNQRVEIVCPLIEETEELVLKLTSFFEILSSGKNIKYNN
jgi:hypothetical protein